MICSIRKINEVSTSTSMDLWVREGFSEIRFTLFFRMIPELNAAWFKHNKLVAEHSSKDKVSKIFKQEL